MKTYAEFYTWSTGYIAGSIPPKFGEPKLIPAVGDRAIIQIDGRLSHDKIKNIAEAECKKRGYVGYKILKGTNLLNCTAKTFIIRVDL